jgi:hypothetical protein
MEYDEEVAGHVGPGHDNKLPPPSGSAAFPDMGRGRPMPVGNPARALPQPIVPWDAIR